MGLISGVGGALGSELGGIGEYAFGSFGLTVVSILIFFAVYHFFFHSVGLILKVLEKLPRGLSLV